jgi:hypothetical protein
MDLHAWITQQVDRVEALAKAATPGSWEGVVDRHQRGVVDASVWSDKLGYYITEKISSGERHEADAHHIGANGPDIVLRRCETDRRILARHTPQPNGTGFEDGWQCQTCSVDGGDGYQYLVPYPCPTVEDLAHAHGITPDVLAGLDHPRPPEPKPRKTDRHWGLPTLTGPQLLGMQAYTPMREVPEALRGPRWKP